MVPPSVTNIMDLSAAESVDIVSDSSMIDVLKNAEGGSCNNNNLDSDLYFQFMPSKPSN